MNTPYLIDMHMHSDNSPDGSDPVSALCEAAQSAGLSVIAITDHCELDIYEKERYNHSIMQSYYEASKARAVFGTGIKILSGVEFGQPCHDIHAAEEALQARPYDFILASVHHLQGMEDFYYLDYTGWNVEELFAKYLDELAQTVEWGCFDALAHLTYPIRYICGEHKIPLDIALFDAKIDEILKLLAEKDKALEINTSGLRQKIGGILPDLKYVCRFKELGGKWITIGSDAHRGTDVGSGIREGILCAQKAGFENITVFEKRIPYEVSIV